MYVEDWIDIISKKLGIDIWTKTDDIIHLPCMLKLHIRRNKCVLKLWAACIKKEYKNSDESIDNIIRDIVEYMNNNIRIREDILKNIHFKYTSFRHTMDSLFCCKIRTNQPYSTKIDPSTEDIVQDIMMIQKGIMELLESSTDYRVSDVKYPVVYKLCRKDTIQARFERLIHLLRLKLEVELETCIEDKLIKVGKNIKIVLSEDKSTILHNDEVKGVYNDRNVKDSRLLLKYVRNIIRKDSNVYKYLLNKDTFYTILNNQHKIHNLLFYLTDNLKTDVYYGTYIYEAIDYIIDSVSKCNNVASGIYFGRTSDIIEKKKKIISSYKKREVLKYFPDKVNELANMIRTQLNIEVEVYCVGEICSLYLPRDITISVDWDVYTLYGNGGQFDKVRNDPDKIIHSVRELLMKITQSQINVERLCELVNNITCKQGHEKLDITKHQWKEIEERLSSYSKN
jgi:hypothetical protein